MKGPILVTGGAGFIGSHVVDALVEAGHEVRVLDVLLPAAHRERPDYLDPRAEWIEGDVRDPHTVAAAVAGVAAVSHQAAMVGLGTDIGDVADYVAHNDFGTAVLLHALADRDFTGPLVLASSMVVYGEGRYACEQHGVVRPPPRAPTGPRRRPLRAAVPGLRRRARAATGPGGRPARPAQRLRRHQARAGAPVRLVRARDGRDRHGAALPQRLRSADAARHALRRGGEHLPVGARGRPTRRACSRTADSGATSSTCATSPAPTCSR